MKKRPMRPYLIPDVRDGLTELERVILTVLYELRKEYGNRHIPMILVYGRVVEMLDASHEDFYYSFHQIQQKRSNNSLSLFPQLPDDDHNDD